MCQELYTHSAAPSAHSSGIRLGALGGSRPGSYSRAWHDYRGIGSGIGACSAAEAQSYFVTRLSRSGSGTKFDIFRVEASRRRRRRCVSLPGATTVAPDE
eukprot:492452-Prymnesium_polylepis.1